MPKNILFFNGEILVTESSLFSDRCLLVSRQEIKNSLPSVVNTPEMIAIIEQHVISATRRLLALQKGRKKKTLIIADEVGTFLTSKIKTSVLSPRAINAIIHSTECRTFLELAILFAEKGITQGKQQIGVRNIGKKTLYEILELFKSNGVDFACMDYIRTHKKLPGKKQ